MQEPTRELSDINILNKRNDSFIPLAKVIVMQFFAPILLYLVIFSSCSSLKPTLQEAEKRLYLAQSGSKNDPFYYTDQYDLIQISGRFREARQFSNHLAAIKKKDKWGFINEKGDVIITCKYDWVSSFGEFGFDRSVAIVKNNINKDRIPMFTACQTVLINTDGEIVSSYYGFVFPIENKLSIVNNGSIFFNQGRSLYYSSDGKWGCIDKYGNEIIKCKYELMYPFIDNITFVRKDGKWGCINEKGKEIIRCEYNAIYFQNDYLIIDTFFDTNSSHTLINKGEVNYLKNTIYTFLDDEYYCFDIKGNQID